MKELLNYLSKHNLSLCEFSFLYCTQHNIDDKNSIDEKTYYYLPQRGWLNEDYTLSVKAVNLLNHVESLFKKTKKTVKVSNLGEDADIYLEEFRLMFPSGRPAIHKKAVRSNVPELRLKFEWFFKQYPEYTWEAVFTATRNYLDDCNQEANRYMQISKYFVCKHDQKTGDIKSDLASYCEELYDDNLEPLEQQSQFKII